MIKVNFTNKTTGCTYVRVNRRTALKAFKDGHTLVVYGKMENPDSMFNSASFWSYVDDSDRISKGIMSDNEWMEYHFNRLENIFEFYNNKKPWWYLPENIAKNYTK